MEDVLQRIETKKLRKQGLQWIKEIEKKESNRREFRKII